ncbi:MAG TPA: helix-turn-helix domain-containing protein [Candidatus Nanoarchaeia archaeon]|nr:helix-turn-helix domain-containing protein [Candidatus Nanoarchaeia archaeon]
MDDNRKLFNKQLFQFAVRKELVLKELGLTDKEIEVYLALLPLGSINLQVLAKKVDLPRTTVYNTLTYLATKGLVSKIIKNHITYFAAVDPHKLIDTLDQKKELVLSVLPELESLKTYVKESSAVEIYEGFKGISTILADIFKEKQQTYYFGSYSKSAEILQHLPKHYRALRLEKKIPAKIVIDTYDEETFYTPAYKKITEMRFLDLLKDFPCMIFIYGIKVALYTVQGDLVGVIIKNKEFSQAMQLIFTLYWDQGKPAKL